MPSRLGDVIATRHLRTNDRERKRVTVRLGRPKQEASGDWVCAFQITGLGKHRLQAGHGVDEFQAIQMALEGIRVMLSETNRRVSWQGTDQHWFPRFVPQAFGPTVEEHLSKLIDREVARLSRELERRHKSSLRRKRGSKRASRTA